MGLESLCLTAEASTHRSQNRNQCWKDKPVYIWSYVPVIGFRDYRCIFGVINIQIGLLTVVRTLQSRNGAYAPVFEQRIRNRSLKCVRHREPGDIICTYFKFKSVIEEIDYLIHSLNCSGRAVESHIELKNVTTVTGNI